MICFNTASLRIPALLCCLVAFFIILSRVLGWRKCDYHIILPQLTSSPAWFWFAWYQVLTVSRLNKPCSHCCQAASCTSLTPIYSLSCHFITKLGLWYKIQHFLRLQLDHPLPLCTFKYRGKVLFCISNSTSLQQKSFVRTSLWQLLGNLYACVPQAP